MFDLHVFIQSWKLVSWSILQAVNNDLPLTLFLATPLRDFSTEFTPLIFQYSVNVAENNPSYLTTACATIDHWEDAISLLFAIKNSIYGNCPITEISNRAKTMKSFCYLTKRKWGDREGHWGRWLGHVDSTKVIAFDEVERKPNFGPWLCRVDWPL